MAVAGHGVMFALDDEFGVREGVVIAGVIDVEVSTDDNVDVLGTETQAGQMLEDVFLVGRGRRWGQRSVGGGTGIDEEALPGGGFDEIAAGAHLEHLAGGKRNRCGAELKEIELAWC